MYKKGDFHLHTCGSDGMLTPLELVKLADKKGIDIMAVTDHDTTSETEEAVECGEKLGVKVIPGIELSTLNKGESIHILGYFRDCTYKKRPFQDFIRSISDYRAVRAKKIVENLDTYFNIKLDYDKILKKAGKIVARPHIAQAIIDGGYDYTWQYIFDHILSEDSKAYVPNKKVSVPEGIDILKKANALVVLAHPVLIKKSSIDEMLKYDFDGVEAIYPMNTPDDTQRLIAASKKYKKIVTAGSDFHGIGKRDSKHGDIGSVSLGSEQIEVFLKKLQQ